GFPFARLVNQILLLAFDRALLRGVPRLEGAYVEPFSPHVPGSEIGIIVLRHRHSFKKEYLSLRGVTLEKSRDTRFRDDAGAFFEKRRQRGHDAVSADIRILSEGGTNPLVGVLVLTANRVNRQIR